MPPKERLTIRLPPAHILQMPANQSQLPTTDNGPTLNDPVIPDDEPQMDSDSDDEGELIDRLDKWLDSDLDSDLGGASDDENDPEWDFDEGETRVKDATYVFCPAPHRKQILHLFTKHFCQHPSFPERNEGSCSAAEIRERAVMEMYQFCWQRGL